MVSLSLSKIGHVYLNKYWGCEFVIPSFDKGGPLSDPQWVSQCASQNHNLWIGLNKVWCKPQIKLD